jgi:hypothetical protein
MMVALLAASALIACWLHRQATRPESVAHPEITPKSVLMPSTVRLRFPQRDSTQSTSEAPLLAVPVPDERISNTQVETPDGYREAKPPFRLPEPPAALSSLLKQFSERPDEFTKAQVLEQFRAWGREGAAAMDYALLQLSGQLRLDSAVAGWRGWVERDVASAAAYVARLLTPGHDYIVYAVAQDFARMDAAAALAWAMTQVPAEYRATASQHVIMEWLRQDPVAALDWTASHVGERERLNRAECTILWEAVFFLSGRDLDGAANWVSNLPSTGALESGVNALLERWLDCDPAAATAWANQISTRVKPGALDSSYAVVALRSAENDQAAGLAWARLISEEELRARTVQQVEFRSARR